MLWRQIVGLAVLYRINGFKIAVWRGWNEVHLAVCNEYMTSSVGCGLVVKHVLHTARRRVGSAGALDCRLRRNEHKVGVDADCASAVDLCISLPAPAPVVSLGW